MGTQGRDNSRKREAILDAAARVFATQGYDAASMDHIAEVSGASKRTVYNHFASKDVLFRAVVDRFLAQSHELKEIPYDPHTSLAAQLTRFADSILALTRHEQWLGLTKVMTGVTVRQPGFVAETMARGSRSGDTLENWLRAATADGRMRVPDPALTARTFWAALSGAFLMPAIYLAPLPAQEADAVRGELVDLLLARYATRRGRPASAPATPPDPHPAR
jgi:TetR/AcrR family transcriptional regulator of autoinduction and epiphytic fitness